MILFFFLFLFISVINILPVPLLAYELAPSFFQISLQKQRNTHALGKYGCAGAPYR